MNPATEITRRDMLQQASCGFGYLAMSALLADSARANTGNPLAPGERPAAKRIALINLSTLAAIADAFDGRPMSHRVVTVHGDA